jgi:uncharacterized protein YdeI (YjbR/CyaY-like superfamily)
MMSSDSMMIEPENSVHPKSRAEWRAWLEEHHTQTEGVWLISYKKASGKPRMEYEESVEEALCYGWIDSKGNKLDEERSMVWFSPRKPGTGWSKINKERVERLLEAGQIAPAGLEKVEAAKLDGSWSALDEVEALIIPIDLQEALEANPPANQYFETFPRSVKRAILEWIAHAKKPETRARHIQKFVEMIENGEKIHS